MHVSRQPNSERWVQSNSPFSLVLRDCIDSNLAVAWSNLLAKAMPVKLWRPTVETESETEWENSEMEKKVSEGVSGESEWLGSVWGWDGEWEREGVCLLCVREGEWEWRVICVRWGVIFENSLFEIESQRLGFLVFHVDHLRPQLKPSFWDSVSL